ncbi:dephospho-CoA kinase [Syntrophomonas erecta]
MKIIGLTGGIASGKSTVSRTLEKLGAIIVDADQVAHTLIEPEQPAWYDIIAVFGREVLNENGTINREKLGAIVFKHPELLEELNRITHPRIIKYLTDTLKAIEAQHPDAVVVLEIPLLYEANMEKICDQVWVVWVDGETQVSRLMERENMSREDALHRINAQMSLDEKANRADFVIDNRNSVEETIAYITKCFNDSLRPT